MSSKMPEWVEKAECRLLLTKNCRNTRQIAKTAYNVIGVGLNQKISMIDGKQTGISFVKGNPLPSLGKLIHKLLDADGYDLEDIVILSLKGEGNSILSGVHKMGQLKFADNRGKDVIMFTTARKFKGLESPVIVVLDIDEYSFGTEAGRRLFYVACSRAMQRLILLVNTDNDGQKKIAQVIDSQLRFPPQGTIAMQTQSEIITL